MLIGHQEWTHRACRHGLLALLAVAAAWATFSTSTSASARHGQWSNQSVAAAVGRTTPNDSRENSITPLVAQNNRISQLGRRFRHGGHAAKRGQLIAFVVGIFALILVAALAARYLNRRDGRYYSPYALFFELCKAHEIPWSDRRILWRLARRHNLEQPSMLFVMPELLEAPESRTELDSQAERVGRLSSSMFDDQFMSDNHARRDKDEN